MDGATRLTVLSFMWGCLSAVSLPIGAGIGIWLKPSQKVTSSLMAFGGGALLFALTIELFAHSLHLSHQGHDKGIIMATVIGSLFGGLLFELLNQALNNRGGFLRKSSLFKTHVRKMKKRNAQQMILGLSRVRFIQLLPADEMAQLIPRVSTRHYAAGETVFNQGEEGRELFFIVRGSVQIIRGAESESRDIASLTAGDTFGEIALISDKPRTATVVATEELEVYVLQKADFEELLKQSPVLQNASRKLVAERLENISIQDESFKRDSSEWRETAQKNLDRFSLPVTGKDLESEVKEHQSSAAMAIWLGIALDGIPESLVIGMLAAAAAASGQTMSIAFIAGVFLANLPEAMSSAVTMQRQGSSFKKIFWMWMSLCVMTGFGAMLGANVFPAEPHGMMRYFISGIEGIAAGAMLTMIANTMLPEAFEHGGSTIAGLSTLIGFIAAICVKIYG